MELNLQKKREGIKNQNEHSYQYTDSGIQFLYGYGKVLEKSGSEQKRKKQKKIIIKFH